MTGIIYAGLLLAFYFLPTLAARPGRRGSVLVVNLFFGWTGLGWVVSLYLAVRDRERVA